MANDRPTPQRLRQIARFLHLVNARMYAADLDHWADAPSGAVDDDEVMALLARAREALSREGHSPDDDACETCRVVAAIDRSGPHFGRRA